MRKLAIAAICCAISAAASVPTVLKLDASKTGAPVQPTMYGLFFEDINYAADGGIYAEKIKNRSFEFPNALTGWIPFGKVSVAESGGPFERNPRYVTLAQEPHRSKHTGLQNEGFVQEGRRVPFFGLRTPRPKRPGNDTCGTRRPGVKG